MLKTGKTKLYKNRKFAKDHPELTAEKTSQVNYGFGSGAEIQISGREQ